MPVLTWRNVDAPNLGDATNGLSTAANLISGSANGFSNALGAFGAAQSKVADNAALQASLQYTDPAAYQAALTNGSLLQGIDTSKLNAATLGALGTRANDLTLQDQNAQNLAKGAYGFQQEQTQDAALKAAQPVSAQIAAAASTGDTAALHAIWADPANQATIAALTPNQQFSLGTQGTTGTTAGLSLTKENQAYSDNQAGQAAAQKIVQSGTDPIGAEIALQAAGLSPGAYAAGRAALTSAGYANPNTPGNTALPAGAGAGSPIGSGATGVTNSINTATGSGVTAPNLRLVTGGGQLDPSIQTVGQLVNNQDAVKAANKGNTASGLYQITADTYAQFAPKALGTDWQSANVNDPQVQDKVGQAIWDSVKSDPAAIQGRWASFTPAQAQAAAGQSWDQIRPQIAQAESSTTPATLLSQLQQGNVNAAVSKAAISTRQQQNATALGFSQSKYEAAANDDSTPIAVATSLSQDQKSPFFGQDTSVIQSMIQQAQNHYAALNVDDKGNPTGNTLNAARAAMLAEAALDPGHTGFLGSVANKYNSLFNNSLKGGQTVDGTKLDAVIANASGGLDAGAAGTKTDLDQNQQNLAAAQQQQATAFANLQAITQRSNGGLAVDPQAVARARNQWAQATALVNGFQTQIQQGANTAPLGQSQARAKVAANATAAVAAQVQSSKVQSALAQALNNNGPYIAP